jgi:hypothetical protein
LIISSNPANGQGDRTHLGHQLLEAIGAKLLRPVGLRFLRVWVNLDNQPVCADGDRSA